MSEQPPQFSATAPRKAWFTKWWVWLVAAVVLVGGFGVVIVVGVSAVIILSGDDLGASSPSAGAQPSQLATPEATESQEPTPTESADAFGSRFDAICDAMTTTYRSTGTVTCQDATTWQANHDQNPNAFPYEYRDVSVDFGGQVAYEIRVITDSATLNYFRTEYTCANIYGGPGSCVVGESSEDTLYSVIFTDQRNDAQANELAEGLRAILASVS